MEKLFNPDYLKHLCSKYGLTPSRQYGQNFLINPEPIEKMLEAGELAPEDTVVEIGPGFGVLTMALSEKAKKVIAFEIEKRLAPYWEEKVKQHQNIEIIWGNVLRQAESLKQKNYKLIANLPYQITSPVIRTFLESGNPPGMMILMVQKEVAERICAGPGEMSVLAVSVQYYAQAEIITQVSRAYFWPQPKVDSAVIKITAKKQKFSTEKTEKFFKLVKIGFANRRKMLLKNLEPLWGKKNKENLRQIFAKIGLSDKARAQELSILQWAELSTYLP